jgi:hypothetical protein
MNKSSTQNIERFYFEHFQKAYTLPKGKIQYGDKPDVIIDSGNAVRKLADGQIIGQELAQEA